MTDEREPGNGDNNEEIDKGVGDGLDAWLAANFPARSSDPFPPVQVPPAHAPPPVQGPPAPEQPAQPSPTPPWPPISTSPVPPAHEPPPTVAFGDLTPEPPQLPPMAEELEGIPAAIEFPPSPTEAFADGAGSSGLDALFGEAKFVDYDDGPSASENPFVRRPLDESAPVDGTSGQGKKGASPQTVLLWIAGGLVAVLALVALFILGTKLPMILGPAPGALVVPTVTPTPTPTATVLPLGPVDPGDYIWDELLGGECINPYVGPWEINYTVVDCEVPHAAQLVTKGTFAETASGAEGGTGVGSASGYPGIEALQSQVNLLCTAATVVDYGKANAYTDIQFEASYAISAQDWSDGNRSYYCFLSRSGGGEITGSIAVPPVAPPPSETPVP